MTRISLVAAVSENGVIGKEGKIPWRLPADLKKFRELTMPYGVGYPLIMGRKTYESIIAATGAPLPGRTHIILTRNKDFHVERGVRVVSSFEEALREAFSVYRWRKNNKEVLVIGGAELYALALPYAHRMHITTVHTEISGGDAFFPEWEQGEWEKIKREEYAADEKNEYTFTYRVWERKEAPPQFWTPLPSDDKHIDMKNVRLPEQEAAMKRILSRGHCPFCPENLAKEHRQPILCEGEYWLVTKNQWPYENTREHILLISRRHAETLSDLSLGAFKEIGRHLRWIEKEYAVSGGAVCMRFGDSAFSGATVRHLHVQIVVPNIHKKEFAPVFFQVGRK